jgi:hypothetical protein
MELWPNLIMTEEDGETNGFREGMEAIFRNQYREDCSTAQYPPCGGHSGFAEVHVVGVGPGFGHE